MNGQRLLLVVVLVIAFTFGGLVARPRALGFFRAPADGPCESDGVAVRYDVSYQTTVPAGYKVDAVEVGDIATGCAGQGLLVELTANGAPIGAGGPVSITDDEMTVAMSAPPLAAEVTGVHVEIGGVPTPSPTPSPSPSPPPDLVSTGPCAGFAKDSRQLDPRGVFGWIVVGTDLPDVLAGAPLKDLICALSSADDIMGGPGGDLIVAGEGDDAVHAGRGRDRVRGWTGRDHLALGRGRDRASGGRDADSLMGRRGRDLLRGGAGNDILRGGRGADVLRGGAGFDVCRADDADIVRSCEVVIQR